MEAEAQVAGLVPHTIVGVPQFFPGQEFDRIACARNEAQVIQTQFSPFVGARCLECAAHTGMPRVVRLTSQGNVEVACKLVRKGRPPETHCVRHVPVRSSGLRLSADPTAAADPKTVARFKSLGSVDLISSNTAVAWRIATGGGHDLINVPPATADKLAGAMAGPVLSRGGTVIVSGLVLYPSALGWFADPLTLVAYRASRPGPDMPEPEEPAPKPAKGRARLAVPIQPRFRIVRRGGAA